MSVFDKVPAEMNFPAEEKEVLSFWREHRIFDKTLEQSKGKPPFVFYEGPPTANGLPHNGHVLTRVIKDLFPRYKTMRGYYVRRKAGWDTHGLPVEVEVEKELRIHGKAAIEEYGVEPFIARCIDSVFRYTRRVGGPHRAHRLLGRPRRRVRHVPQELRRERVVGAEPSSSPEGPSLPRSQGRLVVGAGRHGAQRGRGRAGVPAPSTIRACTCAFRSTERADTALVVWTTTPWTLSSNMYAAVKADVDYVTVQHGNEKLVVAAALREPLAKKLKTELAVARDVQGQGARRACEYTPPFGHVQETRSTAGA